MAWPPMAAATAASEPVVCRCMSWRAARPRSPMGERSVHRDIEICFYKIFIYKIKLKQTKIRK
jgi:hypothetical protein